MKRIAAIVLSAGNGNRFGAQKQFIEFMEKPLWRHSYEKIVNLLGAENVIVVGVDISGGSTRSESVLKGLKALPNITERVVILEAARPLVTEAQLKLLIEEDAPSVSFVMPLVNTVITRNGEHLERDKLYELLTPQAFDYKLLLTAMKTGKYTDLTDETRVLKEEYDISPKLIETTQNLIKITYVRDIPIAEKVYKLLNDNEI